MDKDQAPSVGDWLIVDPMTGAMWTLAADAVGDRLGRGAATAAAKPGSFSVSRVAVLSEVPEDLRPRMVPYRKARK